MASGGDVRVSLTLDDQLSGGLRQADNALQAFAGSTERALMSLNRMAPAAAAVTAVALAAGGATKAYADYEQKVANVGSVLRATKSQIDAVGEAQLDLSRKTVFTSSQISDASLQLAKSGANSATLIKELPDVLNLASAAMTNAKTASTGFVTAQKAFNLTSADSTMIANTMAKAVDSSVGTFEGMTTALKQVGPVANSANISLKDTTTAVAALMNSGLQGDTGTALKVFLQRIQHETPAAQAEVRKLGLEFYDASGKMKSLADIADQLYTTTHNLPEQQRDQSLTTIFGTRGVRVADIFSEEGSQGIQDVTKHEAELGDASDIAKRKLDTLQGSFHQLASSANVLAVQVGAGLADNIRGATDATKGLVDGLTSVVGHTGPLLAVVTGLGLATVAYKGMSAIQELAYTRLGTADQALTVGTKAYNDRSAAIQRYNQLQREEQMIDASIGEQQALIAKGPQYNYANRLVRPPPVDPAMTNRKALLQDQESLLTQGATTAQVEQYAVLKTAYWSDVAEYEKAITAKAAWDAKELQRAASQSAAWAQRLTAFQAGQGPMPGRKPVAPKPYQGFIPPEPFVEPDVSDVIIEQDASLRARITNKVKSTGLAMGELMMPVTVGLLLYDMAGLPIEKAIMDKVTKVPGYDQSKVGYLSQNKPQAYQMQIDAYQQDIDSLTSRLSNPLEKFRTAVIRGLSLGQMDNPNAVMRDNLRTNLKSAQEDAKNVATEMQQANTDMLKAITDGVGNDGITQADALKRVGDNSMQPGTLAYALKNMGMSDGDVQMATNKNRAAIRAYFADQNQLVEEEANVSLAASDRKSFLTMLGAPQKDISADVDDGSGAAKKRNDAIIKLYEDQATAIKKHLADTASAASQANAAVDKIDFTKGFAGLDKVLPDIERAMYAFKTIGADTSSLETLHNIGSAFDKIKSSFEGSSAMQNFRGNMAMLTVTDESISTLDAFAKKVKEVNDVTKETQDHGGPVTADQIELLNKGDKILDSVSEQVRKLMGNEAGDLLSMAKNLPDMVAYNNEIREMVKGFGGAASAQQIIEESSKRAIDSAMNVKDITKEVAEHPDVIKMMIDDEGVKTELDNMHGDISLLSEHAWEVIVKAIMGDSVESLKTFNGILAAVPSAVTVKLGIQVDQSALAYQSQNGGQTQNRSFMDDINADIANKQVSAQSYVKFGADMDQARRDVQTFNNEVSQSQSMVHVMADASGAYATINGVVAYARGQSATITITTNHVDTGTGGGGGTAGAYANGGDVNGDWAIVGDTPSGDMSAAELVDFRNRRVISNRDAVRMGLFGKGYPKYAGGIDTTAGADPGYVGDSKWGKLPKVDFGTTKVDTAGLEKAHKILKDAAAATKTWTKDLFDASEAASFLGDNISKMKPDQMKELVKYSTLFGDINKKNAEAKLPGGATADQKQAADSQAANKTLAQVSALSQMMVAGNVPLDEQRSLWGEIEGQLGAAGPLIHQQVDDYMAIEQNLAAITADQEKMKQLEADHTQLVRDRGDAERTYQRDQQDQKNTMQDAKTQMDRMWQDEAWGIEDVRKKTQRRWEDNQKSIEDAKKAASDLLKTQMDAITLRVEAENTASDAQKRQMEDAKTAEDDAWTKKSREFEDQQRFLDHYGTTKKKSLQDELDLLDAQYKQITANNGAQEQLLQGKVKSANTNQDAFGLASQLSALKEADTLATRNQKDTKDNIKEAMDAEDKLASQEKFDLETQKLQEQRLHEDRLKAMDNESTAASRLHEDNLKKMDAEKKALQTTFDLQSQKWDSDLERMQNSIKLQQRKWEDEDTLRSRSHTLIQQNIQDIELAQTRADEKHKRDLEDTQAIEDRKYEDDKKNLQDEIDSYQKNNTELQKHADALGGIVKMWGDLSVYAGDTADVLLAALSQYEGSGKYTPPKHARAGVINGLSLMGEDGPELVYGGGVAIDAQTTARTMAMAAGMGKSGSNIGQVNIHVHQRDGESTAELVGGLKTMIQDLQQEVGNMKGQQSINIFKGAKR